MSTIALNKIVTSQRSKPVDVVISMIVTVEDYSRGKDRSPGALIKLVGGEELRVIEPRETVIGLMHG